jgi:diacylglycerol kinase (ATP)
LKFDKKAAPARFSVRQRLQSFKFAIAGLRHLLKSEHNSRIHLAASIATVAFSLALQISAEDWRWIVLAIAIVWTAEALNSALEGVCDVISPGFDERIGRVKDMAASGVLVVAVASAIIGLITFFPYIVRLMNWPI